MNPLTKVKNLNKMNERELQTGVVGSTASWHDQYKDSAWVFVGGLPFDLTEGDVLCIFSQYGEPVTINLVRDKQTGKSRGFAFVCYEDQRSTILAVDNLNGSKVCGRTLRVDHVEAYRKPNERGDEDDITMHLRTHGLDGIESKDEQQAKRNHSGARASEPDSRRPTKTESDKHGESKRADEDAKHKHKSKRGEPEEKHEKRKSDSGNKRHVQNSSNSDSRRQRSSEKDKDKDKEKDKQEKKEKKDKEEKKEKKERKAERRRSRSNDRSRNNRLSRSAEREHKRHREQDNERRSDARHQRNSRDESSSRRRRDDDRR